ncbi:hypothetical protein C8Q77DRAFT_1121185, partial [Trametes polyzona]
RRRPHRGLWVQYPLRGGEANCASKTSAALLAARRCECHPPPPPSPLMWHALTRSVQADAKICRPAHHSPITYDDSQPARADHRAPLNHHHLLRTCAVGPQRLRDARATSLLRPTPSPAESTEARARRIAGLSLPDVRLISPFAPLVRRGADCVRVSVSRADPVIRCTSPALRLREGQNSEVRALLARAPVLTVLSQCCLVHRRKV